MAGVVDEELDALVRLLGMAKIAAPTRALHLGRAAGYGALAGVGLHAARHMLAATQGIPTDPEDSLTSSAATSAAGGAGVAAMLNLLNRVTAKRR